MSNLINNLFEIRNSIILITGVSGQVGTNLAQLYLENGCKVYGVDLKKNKIKNKNFKFYKINISIKKNAAKIFNNILKKEKKIDIIVNNAAVSFFSNILKKTEREIDNTYDANLKSVINITTEYFRKHKIKKLKSCKIINIASIYGLLSPEFKIYGKNDRFSSEIYGATKAGLIQLTKYYSVLFAKYNILVNCISPGGIENSNVQSRKFQKKYSSRVPLRRMANVEDLYTAVMFLSSKKTKYITGQNLIIDGGLSAK